MASPIKYKTILSSFTKGEKPCYLAQVIHNGTNYRDDMVTKVASRGGIGKETVDYVLSLFFTQLGDEFKDGMRIEMEDLAGNLSVQGGFPTKDGKWNPLVNQLVPNLHAKGDLGSCLVGQTTATTLNATFATMPPAGTYWFVVASRGGLGSEFGVAQAKRKVTVVAATTAVNGGN